LLDRVKATWEQSRHAIGRLLSRKADLDERMGLFTKARVDIGVGLSGSVDLVFGRTVRLLRRPYEDGSFSMEDGLILFTPRDGDSATVEG